ISAHLCSAAHPIDNSYDFGFLGDSCTNVAIGGGDVEQKATFPGGVSSADLSSFRVGVGSASWENDRGFTHDLTCGPGQPCAVAVLVQVTDAPAVVSVPLCFGDACPPEPGDGGANGGGGPGPNAAADGAPAAASTETPVGTDAGTASAAAPAASAATTT